MKLEAAHTKLTDSRDKPRRPEGATTTSASASLADAADRRVPRSLSRNPHQPADHRAGARLGMREADVAIRLRQPTQPDLIQRKLFTVHFHVYASPEYLKRFGTPRITRTRASPPARARRHAADASAGPRGWLIDAGRDGKGPRTPGSDQQCARRAARMPARPRHRDAAGLSGRGEWRAGANVRDADDFTLDAYFVYPEELKSVARIQVFRDFLVVKAQRWDF